MYSFKRSVRNWFGFTRRERRSTFLLLVIIFMISALRTVIPESRIAVEEIPVSLAGFEEGSDYNKAGRPPENTSSGTGSGERKSSRGRPSYQVKKTDLNKCDSTDLERLPGIGPVLSVRIIKYRNLLGGFVSVDQLKEVYGLRDSTYRIIALRVTADSTDIERIRINTAGFGELLRHPYLAKSDVQAIIKYRDLKGRIGGISELIQNHILSNETSLKIGPYLIFD